MSEEAWSGLVQEYIYASSITRKHFKNDMREVLYELATEIYRKR